MTTATKSPRTIFLEAVENHAPDAWPQFLDTACGDDDTLRLEVQRLLNAHAAASRFMGRPAAPRGAGILSVIHTLDHAIELLGATIGRYQLVEQIGEGGMGVVYVAEQTEPIRRQVALKIIKPGYDTRQIIARFEAERQTLALMDHPNIAKILDAGTTDGPEVREQTSEVSSGHEPKTATSDLRPLASTVGRPYFVMELVRGLPITDFCQQQQLSLRQRLTLFITVCQAVQHAHQKGIIHRDLKPSNVLVAMIDGQPVPKNHRLRRRQSALPAPLGRDRHRAQRGRWDCFVLSLSGRGPA